MSETFEPHTVIYLDVNEKPVGTLDVTRRCKTCERTPTWETRYWEVVSPGGCEHLAHEDDYGMTACGRDGTREGWWWAL